MRTHSLRSAAIFGVLMVQSASGQLSIVSTQPTLNANNVPGNGAISVTFDRAVDPATFSAANFKVFGKLSGPVVGETTFTVGNTVATFTPGTPLLAGEVAMVVMSNALRAGDGSALRSAGYTFMFTTAVTPSPGKFQHLADIDSRDSSGATTRIYGGVACDLNRDGWSDLTVVNEVSADLRVFLNRADGSGLFQPMIEPPTPIPNESSPNEVADFDSDGFIDVVTSSADDDNIAIAFGNGDGTFDAPLVIAVGAYPRGFGITDADGDGDMDITVTNANSSNVSFVRNLGARSFAPPTFFDGGVAGEYGMTAADMNNDGILDLVIGGRNNEQVSVMRGNGDGTFTLASSRPIGGSNWVVVCGDLNNDGNMDVSAANSFSNNGSILLGNGNGTLQPAVVTPTGGHTVSTDLADLDGDGDLDWVISSYGASRWYVHKNNGSGAFTADVEFPAPANPSCAILVDLDNDGDIDLALTDEIADVIVLFKNGCPSDFNLDGFVTGDDFDEYVAAFELGSASADFNQDGFVTGDDFDGYVLAFETGC